MSLAIDIESVVGIQVRGRYFAVKRGSLDFDCYEFVTYDAEETVVSQGTGFQFDTGIVEGEEPTRICGPLSAIDYVVEVDLR